MVGDSGSWGCSPFSQSGYLPNSMLCVHLGIQQPSVILLRAGHMGGSSSSLWVVQVSPGGIEALGPWVYPHLLQAV